MWDTNRIHLNYDFRGACRGVWPQNARALISADILEQIPTSLSLVSQCFLSPDLRKHRGNMSRKRKDSGKIGRMTDFLIQPCCTYSQNGASKHADTAYSSHTRQGEITQQYTSHKHKPHRDQISHSQSSSSSSSPVKVKQQNMEKADRGKWRRCRYLS